MSVKLKHSWRLNLKWSSNLHSAKSNTRQDPQEVTALISKSAGHKPNWGRWNFQQQRHEYLYLPHLWVALNKEGAPPLHPALGRWKWHRPWDCNFFHWGIFFQGWGRGKSWSKYQLDGHITRSREMLSEVASFNLALNYTRSGSQLFQSATAEITARLASPSISQIFPKTPQY